MNIKNVIDLLTESEIMFEKLDNRFQKYDCRVWMLRIDPDNHNLFLVCNVNREDINEVNYDILYSKGIVYGIEEDSVLDKVFQLLDR